MRRGWAAAAAAAAPLLLAGLAGTPGVAASESTSWRRRQARWGEVTQRPAWWTPAAEMAAFLSGDDPGFVPLLPRGPADLELLVLLEGSGAVDEVTGQAVPQPATSAGAAPTLQGAPERPLPDQRHWQGIVSLLRVTISFTFVLKSLCIATNIIYQVSPLPIARQFAIKGDTGDTDPAPFLSVAFCCCQFSFYGLFACVATGKTGFLVLVYSNMLGILMGTYYVYSFLSNCVNPKSLRLTSLYLKAIAVVVGCQLAAMLALPVGRALLFVGLVSSGCGLVSSTSLVTTVPEVIRTRSSKSLPVPLLLCGEVSCLLWVACGFTLWDMYIIVPNILCTLITSFALALVWYFPSEPEGSPMPKFEGYGALDEPTRGRRPSSSPTAGSGEPGSLNVPETGGTWEPSMSWRRQEREPSPA